MKTGWIDIDQLKEKELSIQVLEIAKKLNEVISILDDIEINKRKIDDIKKERMKNDKNKNNL